MCGLSTTSSCCLLIPSTATKTTTQTMRSFTVRDPPSFLSLSDPCASPSASPTKYELDSLWTSPRLRHAVTHFCSSRRGDRSAWYTSGQTSACRASRSESPDRRRSHRSPSRCPVLFHALVLRDVLHFRWPRTLDPEEGSCFPVALSPSSVSLAIGVLAVGTDVVSQDGVAKGGKKEGMDGS